MTETTTTDIGLRERKKRETKRLIRRVALDLALEHGVENLTVGSIAQGAEISPRTFFNYFDHKDDALVTDSTVAAESLRHRIIARPAEESPLHAIRAAIAETDVFTLMNTDRGRMLARQQLVRQHPTLVARQLNQHARMEQSLADAIAHRLDTDVSADLRPTLVASVAGSAMRVALQWWSTHADETLSHLLAAAFDLLEEGLFSHSATGSVAPETAPQEGNPSPDE